MKIISKQGGYVLLGSSAPNFSVQWLIQHDDGRHCIASRKYADKETAEAARDELAIMESAREYFERS